MKHKKYKQDKKQKAARRHTVAKLQDPNDE